MSIRCTGGLNTDELSIQLRIKIIKDNDVRVINMYRTPLFNHHLYELNASSRTLHLQAFYLDKVKRITKYSVLQFESNFAQKASISAFKFYNNLRKFVYLNGTSGELSLLNIDKELIKIVCKLISDKLNLLISVIATSQVKLKLLFTYLLEIIFN
jgi:hypothetical protein